MKIDIVIPNYNGTNLIKKNLPVLISCIKKYEVGEIIIVDDFSKSQEFDELQSFVKKTKNGSDVKIKLLRNDKNLGFSSTVDHGVLQASAEYIVLLNTDVTPEKNFLDKAIFDLDRNPDLFGVGMLDKSVEGGKIVLRGRGIASWKRGFVVHSRGEVDKTDTFWISGGSSIVRRELFVKLGGFDTLYNPFYWEDIDLSYRARKSGYNLEFNPASIVEHRHEEGAIKKYYKPSRIKKIAYRNQFIFVWKNITDTNLFISHFVWLPFHFTKAIISLDFAYLHGFLLALAVLPDIIKKRNMQKKLYKRGDQELLYEK